MINVDNQAYNYFCKHKVDLVRKRLVYKHPKQGDWMRFPSNPFIPHPRPGFTKEVIEKAILPPVIWPVQTRPIDQRR
jgi:hypothetical protein